MSPLIVIALTGVAALAILIPLAVVQRRATARTAFADTGAEATALPPPPGVPLGRPKPVAAARSSITTGQIALGVFIGLWCFTISAALIGFALIVAAREALGKL